MRPIIDQRRLREDHPCVRPGWWVRLEAWEARLSRRLDRRADPFLWWLSMHARRLAQEILELYFDVPPPTGRPER